MASPSAKRGGRTGLVLLLFLGLVGLCAAVAYLMSDINHRRYRLTSRQGVLMVERGLFLPAGFGPYIPQDEALRDAYAPVQVPDNETPGALEMFDERSEVDRALFDTLSGWARQRLSAGDSKTLELAATYVKRLEILPGLSEEQRHGLRSLRAQLAWRNGARLIDESLDKLQRAREAIGLAISLGAGSATEAKTFMREIERRIELFKDLPKH